MKNIATGTILAVLMISAGAVIFSPTAAQQPPARSWCYGASDPESARAYNNRGNAYRDKRNYDRATADYTEAIRLYPTSLLHAKRGFAYQVKGDLDSAIRDFSEAIRLNPNNATYYAYRGEAY
jgi:tetratricopeptide (TPR) repeat protein